MCVAAQVRFRLWFDVSLSRVYAYVDTNKHERNGTTITPPAESFSYLWGIITTQLLIESGNCKFTAEIPQLREGQGVSHTSDKAQDREACVRGSRL